MAIVTVGRYRPGAYQRAPVVANEGADGASGTLCLPVQVIQYDDEVVTTYRAGHPDTEAALIIVDEDVLQVELAALVGLTDEQANDVLDAALDVWMTQRAERIAARAAAIRVAQTLPPKPLVTADSQARARAKA